MTAADRRPVRDESPAMLVDELNDRLRGPLTPIVGYTEMLLGGEIGGLSATQERALERVFAAAGRLVMTTAHFVELANEGRLLLVPGAGADPSPAALARSAPAGASAVIDLRGLPLGSAVLTSMLARAAHIASAANRTLLFRVADEGATPLLTAGELQAHLQRADDSR
jgi:hypothetical protein